MKGNSLKGIIHRNNFDFLRFIFASFVIITHAYPLSGQWECDLVCQFTSQQLSFSYIGVRGFFVLSGYMVFQSLQRSSSLFDYFKKRLLRLFPALFVLLFLTFCLAVFINTSGIPFWKNKTLFTYFINNILLYGKQFEINGVFESNPYKAVINGSLWTIKYEFTMYLLLAILFSIRQKKKLLLLFFIVLFLLMNIGNLFFYNNFDKGLFTIDFKFLLDFGLYFVSGVILSLIEIEKFKYRNQILIVSIIMFFIAIYFNCFLYFKAVLLPVPLILLGLKSTPLLSSFSHKIGDLSYGIYLYGFLVQQLLMYYFRLNTIELMMWGLFGSVFLAYFSWHLIEKRALMLK